MKLKSSRYTSSIRLIIIGILIILIIFFNWLRYTSTNDGISETFQQIDKGKIVKTRQMGDTLLTQIIFAVDTNHKQLPFLAPNLLILYDKLSKMWNPSRSSSILRWSSTLPRGNKDVVYLLVRKITDAKASLTCLRNTFLDKFPYPVILFYEQSLAIKDAMELKALLPKAVTLYLQQIVLNTPFHIDESKIDWKIGPKIIGYRHMIQFQSILVHDTQIMQEVGYYLRLDDDSCVHKMDFDVFTYMRKNNKLFGYVQLVADNAKFNQNLTTQTKLYLENNRITLNEGTSFYKSWPAVNLMVFNNFEISKMSLWVPPSPLRKYLDFIDKSGIMYYKRVGDAPVKTHAIALHLPASKVHCLHQVHFNHKNDYTYNRGVCTVKVTNTPLRKIFKSNTTVPLIGEKFHVDYIP